MRSFPNSWYSQMVFQKILVTLIEMVNTSTTSRKCDVEKGIRSPNTNGYVHKVTFWAWMSRVENWVVVSTRGYPVALHTFQTLKLPHNTSYSIKNLCPQKFKFSWLSNKVKISFVEVGYVRNQGNICKCRNFNAWK